MSIDWQATVALLDADPDIGTPAGTAVLSALVSAGRRYDSAGQPDVMYESGAHKVWVSKSASQKLNEQEPPFYVAGYYARSAPGSGSASLLNKGQLTAEDLAVLPREGLAAYKYWLNRAEQLPAEREASGANARRIANYYIAKAEQAERAARAAHSPSYGQIESELVSAVSAAQAFLAT
jgi:hypothetical protein